MKNRARWGAAVVVALAGLAPAGDEQKTYEIDWKERWEAKQVVTVTVKESMDSETTLDGKSMAKRHKALDAVYVVRCDEAGAHGEATNQTVFVRSWKSVLDSTTDDSLEGTTFVVRDGEWKLLEEKPLSELATTWIDDTFGTSRVDEPLENLAPKRLTIGQPWKPDSKAVAESWAKTMGGISVDASESTMELVLESAERAPPDATGRCSFKAHLPIINAPNLPSNAAISPGSGMKVSGTRIGPLTKATMLRNLHVEREVTLFVERTSPQGKMKFTNKTNGSQDRNVVAGGEIPEAKPAEPGGGK